MEDLRCLEDSLVAQVDQAKLMEYTSNIAKWIRVSGTQGEIESLLYCQELLDQMGYTTKLSRHPGFISIPVRSSLEVISPEHMSFDAITHPFVPSTPFCGLKRDIVLESFPAVAGKIVLADGLPEPEKVQMLEDMGAAGVVFVQDDHLHNMQLSPLWGSPTEKTEGLMIHIPVVSIVRSDGQKLKDLIAKGTVLVCMESVVDTGWKEIPLLEAEIKAKDSDRFVLFSSHIDSWDYGAMDNGAANATLLECARVLSQKRNKWQRGLRLALWSGHSQGKFFGSSWYADNHFEELEDNCVGHVYVDSTGGKNADIIIEAPVMPQTKQLAADVIKRQTGEEFLGKRIGHYADQSFFGVGLTSTFGTFSEQDALKDTDVISFKMGDTKRAGGLGWWWHTSEDTLDKIDPKLLVRDTKVYVGVIWRILCEPVLPYDFRALVAEIKDTVVDLCSKLEGRFDLSPVVQRVAQLEAKVNAFYLRVSDVTAPGDEAKKIESLMLRLSQLLVRISFHAENHFDFDLSGPMYPIPSLECGQALACCPQGSYRYHVLATELRRGTNRVMRHLRDAISLLDAY
ncbi:MAG: M28 family peptidase [Firmicutes bacterium]|nr:M28 family peptidase [Bacillota bacterium]